mgnify:CR=1 FL=1
MPSRPLLPIQLHDAPRENIHVPIVHPTVTVQVQALCVRRQFPRELENVEYVHRTIPIQILGRKALMWKKPNHTYQENDSCEDHSRPAQQSPKTAFRLRPLKMFLSGPQNCLIRRGRNENLTPRHFFEGGSQFFGHLRLPFWRWIESRCVHVPKVKCSSRTKGSFKKAFCSRIAPERFQCVMHP